MTLVSRCEPNASTRSNSSTSALLPMLTRLLKPIPLALAVSRIAASSAPDWEI